MRGTAAGLLTAALAVAAHAAGSGALPTGAVVAQLAVLAATVGALAATISRAADARILLGLLAAGLDRNAAAGTVSSVTWTAAPKVARSGNGQPGSVFRVEQVPRLL